jgi:hypothetical protein
MTDIELLGRSHETINIKCRGCDYVDSSGYIETDGRNIGVRIVPKLECPMCGGRFQELYYRPVR